MHDELMSHKITLLHETNSLAINRTYIVFVWALYFDLLQLSFVSVFLLCLIYLNNCKDYKNCFK